MRQATYEIRLRGQLPPSLMAGLDGSASEVGGETVLLTLDVDQESLHQLISRLQDLGIELLEVRRATAIGSPSEPRQS